MPYNRNKFLQANFRFLVSDAGNLRRHEAEADLMLDWDDVVQVRHHLIMYLLIMSQSADVVVFAHNHKACRPVAGY